jgi:hypothetical protein
MSGGQQETPVQEAISLLSISCILLSVACYVACLDNLPVVSPTLLWVATIIYAWFPQLGGLHQVPMLVASATVGGIVWLTGLPFAPLLARAFNSQQIASLERQTVKLKRNRARIIKNRRDKDGWNAS